ncbi:MAG: 3-oxoacyl-[acyl-carrier-protein] reductase [Elusimicrobiaceae bacterium]
MKQLEGKIAAITGGTRGIGLAVAELFAREGAAVALCSTSEEKAKETAARIAAQYGVQTLGVKADVSLSADCENFEQAVSSTLGVADILVNNAGIARDNLTLRMKEEDWDAVIDANLKGAFLMTKAFVRPMLKKRAGRIINMASVVGQTGNAGQPNYCAAKSGIIGLTKSHAREFAPRGICVNAIAPGFVETDMTAQLSAETREKVLESIPLRRFATAQDIALAALFLSGEGSSYITGQVLGVNGGMYI